ncbi:MAG: SLC13 family permease, partial [Methanobacterium sp.]
AQTEKTTFTSDQGFKITYTKTWGSLANKSTGIRAVDQLTALTMSPNVINVVTVASGKADEITGTTLQTYTDYILNSAKQSSGYSLLSYESTTIGGQPASKIVYTATVPQRIGSSTQNAQITHTAKEALKEMGSLTKNELIMLITFILMLVLWIFGAYINIDSTTAALIGLIILLSSGVLKLEEAISEKGAWETLLWFGTLLMLSDYLTKFGVTTWIEGNIKHALVGFNPMLAITLVIISYFYVHYFFASVTAHMTVMYTTYLLILVHFKVPGFLAAIGLAILSNLSGGLTHFGISSAPIYFGSHYLTTKEWWKVGGLISTFNLIIWIIAGAIWWKILGWW